MHYADEKAIKDRLVAWKFDELFVLDVKFYLKVHKTSLGGKMDSHSSFFLKLLSGLGKFKRIKQINVKDISINEVFASGEKLEVDNRGGKVDNLEDIVAIANFSAAKLKQCSIVSSLLDKDDNEQYRKILGTSYALSSINISSIDKPSTPCARPGCVPVVNSYGTHFYRTCKNHKS